MICICHVISGVAIGLGGSFLTFVLGSELVSSISRRKKRPIAQRSEQRTHNPLVLGSNPSRPTELEAGRDSRHLASVT